MSMRVIIAEDDAFTRETLRDYLSSVGKVQVLATAANGEEAVSEVREHPNVDLVILDIRMPVLDGIQAATQIKRLKPKIKVLLLTSSTEENHVVEGLRSGIDGYVLKSEPESLLGAVEALAQGRVVFDPIVNEIISRHWRASMPKELGMLQVQRRIDQLSREKGLTGREREILQLICDGKSNAEVAEILKITEDTVKKHLTHLLEKVGCRSRTECVARILKGEEG